MGLQDVDLEILLQGKVSNSGTSLPGFMAYLENCPVDLFLPGGAHAAAGRRLQWVLEEHAQNPQGSTHELAREAVVRYPLVS